MNSQTWASGSPPANSAGPSERAGFTDVPVRGMPIRWTAVRPRPMARPAKPGAAALPVTSRITRTNAKVSSASRTNAPPRLTVAP